MPEKIISVSKNRWKTVTLRKMIRGVLKVRICRIVVYVWDRESEAANKWFLVVTKSFGRNPDVKISLTNDSARTNLRRLGWMQRQRFWVERVFEDAKNECGMADYHVREWNARHHHMALVMMSILFMLTEKVKLNKGKLKCQSILDMQGKFSVWI